MTPQNTSRLALRQATLADTQFIVQLLSEPAWKRFIGTHQVDSEETAEDYLNARIFKTYESGLGLWVVELKGESKPIGICGLVNRPFLEQIDIGFAFLEAYQGQGYAFEASEAVIAYAANEIKLASLWAITKSDNTQSIRLLERLSFRYKQEITNPENELIAVYELLHDEVVDNAK